MSRSLPGIAVVLVAVLGTSPAHGQQQQGATANPHGGFFAPCGQCHVPDAWKPTRVSAEFRHAPDRFPLDGAHLRVACTTCHTRLDFSRVPTSCASCHQDAHNGELGARCGSCHSTRSFLDMARMRQAHQATTFPLTGGHLAVDCRSCHTPRAPGQLAFVNLPTQCVSCHLTDYNATNDPAHAAAGFPTDCASCHTTRGWLGANFNHTAFFPITSGAHRGISCSTCHTTPNNFAVFDCLSCHHQSETDSHHTGVKGYVYASQNCYACHRQGRSG